MKKWASQMPWGKGKQMAIVTEKGENFDLSQMCYQNLKAAQQDDFLFCIPPNNCQGSGLLILGGLRSKVCSS